MGRAFIEILETWQFGLSIKHVFFVLVWLQKIICRTDGEFLKNVGLAQKKSLNRVIGYN
jgi:hypothetical protein